MIVEVVVGVYQVMFDGFVLYCIEVDVGVVVGEGEEDVVVFVVDVQVDCIVFWFVCCVVCFVGFDVVVYGVVQYVFQWCDDVFEDGMVYFVVGVVDYEFDLFVKFVGYLLDDLL